MLSDDLVRGQAQHLIGALIAHEFLPKAMPHESYIVLWDVVMRQLKCVNREGARAIESAATAPLLARIAELEKWQAEHWTALEIINNYFVSKDLLLVVEDGGPDAAARNIVHSVVALERELEEARKALEAARNWIAERPDMRQCSAGKIVAELTRTLSANAAIKEQT